jgi:hypothetical protein
MWFATPPLVAGPFGRGREYCTRLKETSTERIAGHAQFPRAQAPQIEKDTAHVIDPRWSVLERVVVQS